MSATKNQEEILARIRDFKNKNDKLPKETYRPPTAADFRAASLLCFDQTLSNCGWAVLDTHNGISVSASGVIRPTKGLKGFEATLVKSVEVSDGVEQVFREFLDPWIDEVVTEMPAVAGHRTESSLVALVTIVRVMDSYGMGLPVMVSRQQAGKVLCDDRYASKAVSNRLVDDLVGDRHPAVWNEHVRDAVFVGLQHLRKGDL